LLSKHPEIVALHPFHYEGRLTSYWMEVLQALAEPTSYMQAIVPELYDGDWWLGDRRPNPLPLQLTQVDVPRWLGSENVEVLAGFCQSRLDGFYKRLAEAETQVAPRYFAEKCRPGSTPRLIGELYPDGREILLVRDPRDMICSILDFNAKRGFQLWGRDKRDNDDDWFSYLGADASRMLESWRERRERTHVVRYEDLVADPESTLGAAFTYLGVDGGAGTIRRVIEGALKLTPEAQVSHRTSTSIEASVGRWRQELSPERQAKCVEVFREFLYEFRYESATGGARPPVLVGKGSAASES
jgi:hypothetical protein